MKEISLERIIRMDKESSPLAPLMPIEIIEVNSPYHFLTVGERHINFLTPDEARNDRAIKRALGRIVKSINLYRTQALEKSCTARSINSLTSYTIEQYLKEGVNGFIVNESFRNPIGKFESLFNTPSIRMMNIKVSIYSTDEIYFDGQQANYFWQENIIGLLKLERGDDIKLGRVLVTEDSLIDHLKDNELDIKMSFLPTLDKPELISLVKLEDVEAVA